MHLLCILSKVWGRAMGKGTCAKAKPNEGRPSYPSLIVVLVEMYKPYVGSCVSALQCTINSENIVVQKLFPLLSWPSS